MIELVGNFFSKVKGKVGGYVVCNRNGKTFLRKAPVRKKGRSRKQEMVIRRLVAATMLYCIIKNDLISLIWKNIVSGKSSNALNNFVKANHSIFNINEEIEDYSLLKISIGKLSLPLGMNAKMVGKNLLITWSEEDEIYTGHDDDLLYCFLMHDDYTLRSLFLDRLNVKRSDTYAEIDLSEDDKLVHLYCFFGAKDGSAFSPSKYIKLEI